MPTPVGHSLFGLSMYMAVEKRPLSKVDVTGPLLYVVLVNLPDIDYTPILAYGFGAVKLYHQAYTHNLGFCFVAAVVVTGLTLLFKKEVRWPLFFLYFLLIYSHVILDALGADGNPPFGVQAFWPFSSAYFISPLSIFIGAEKAQLRELFSVWNFYCILIELGIFLPAFIFIYRSKRRQIATNREQTTS
ncbi:metal-dependent hydrolase [candidate division CSSED10-310 bacterium]|uniref:Metal-dependent hydrolase n=1 Tax=candidate division CSSED10-310 bacterium TaxID=2855610 RepID=A0ABV6YV36_UNCC1